CAEDDRAGVRFAGVAVVVGIAVSDLARTGGQAPACRKPLFEDRLRGIDNTEWVVGSFDDNGRRAMKATSRLLELGRRVAEIGGRQQVAERNARIQRRNIAGEIPTSTFGRSGCRFRLRI